MESVGVVESGLHVSLESLAEASLVAVVLLKAEVFVESEADAVGTLEEPGLVVSRYV